MEHLVANSGLQFITQEIELNPADGFQFHDTNKKLRYAFLDTVEQDPVFENLETRFDFCLSKDDKLIRLHDLIESDSLVTLSSGGYYIAPDGMPEIRDDINVNLFEIQTDAQCYTINNLSSYKLKISTASQEKEMLYKLLLDKWLPMPMFCLEPDGSSSAYPTGWCRVRMNLLSEDSKSGVSRFRLTWAFDTTLSDDEFSIERPVFFDTDPESKVFSLCNRADVLLGYFFSGESEVCACTNVTEYLARILGIDLSAVTTSTKDMFKFVAYYIYLINLLRLKTSIEVTLHNHRDTSCDIPVDMVLDIGNSRTCGVLFENGSFHEARMLELRNLSRPWVTYNTAFDMRIVFRRADFGNDIITEDESLFAWKSFVRVGNEAKELVYNAASQEGLSQKTNNYSSPKRYLWDLKPFVGKWEFLISKDDPLNVRVSDSVYISGLSKLFEEDGTYTGASAPNFGQDCRYSRSSLMTFVFIEIFQQAMMQMNSVSHRVSRGNIDCRRVLRNVIITAPTAMPNVEQMKLRQCAYDAYEALITLYPSLPHINIVPTPDSIEFNGDDTDERLVRSWTYDEATASQFVYLYAEIAQKYNGDAERLLTLKGRPRKDLADSGYDKNALTIGSVDIGAGTTDLMICAYENVSDSQSKLKPVPLFWDSFYLAGDDILKNIILRVLIEGHSDNDCIVGSLSSILENRLMKLKDEDFYLLKPTDKAAFRKLADDIRNAPDFLTRKECIKRYAANLIGDYFGADSGNMDFMDKRCRADFNTQVSMPIAQKMLDLLHDNRSSKVYSFDEIFVENKPADYVLNHFYEHFGFRLEEIKWRYDPVEISAQVRSTMEPLMKQISIILDSYGVDVLVLAGRPSSLPPLFELFLKYYPVSPDRIICLNNYNVGSWYPFANPQGYFYDQKSVVAVGAMVGYLASTGAFHGFSMDFTDLIRKMKPTANYVGQLTDTDRLEVKTSILTPRKGSVSVTVDGFPYYLGCKQLDTPTYQARPLYAINNFSGKSPLVIQLARDYQENRERLEIEDVYDTEGNAVSLSQVELCHQSIAADSFWLDNGVFKFLK